QGCISSSSLVSLVGLDGGQPGLGSGVGSGAIVADHFSRGVQGCAEGGSCGNLGLVGIRIGAQCGSSDGGHSVVDGEVAVQQALAPVGQRICFSITAEQVLVDGVDHLVGALAC